MGTAEKMGRCQQGAGILSVSKRMKGILQGEFQKKTAVKSVGKALRL